MAFILSQLGLAVKGEKNKTTPIDTVNVDIQTLFASKSNVRHLTREMYVNHKSHGGKHPFTKFKADVPGLVKAWTDSKLLDWYEGLAHVDWDEVIRFVNDKFVEEHCHMFIQQEVQETYQPMDTNVFRESSAVGTLNEFGDFREKRDYAEMGVEDIKTLDVWKEWHVDLHNSKFRRNNQIPLWQKAGHTRHLDRGNDGLRDRDYATASRRNPVRGYDMSGIYEGMRKYEDLSWDQL